MQIMTLGDFASRVNETFTVSLDEGQGNAPFVLVEARPLSGQPVVGQSRDPFALLFRNEAAILFPQRIYQMHHEATGPFGIFLVPIAREQAGFLYQAVFN
ncbi:DUF6916 family protein [Oleiagrimonas soli]|uniref:DUF6916 domain-containing protein n=1 Tax=Oleiagrimonas soli TaxID=1543381 RepID=A0A099D1R9_9GAMM|nr:hypothetical protein [Oleiagrimonas soli]KGI79265.1 hypothetical protein LF63_0100335 [Oleiagrimonas soli]MBB6184834.1 hypothetical protein [Oleiagrimonas soli]